jgi:hypothetical protein
MQNEATPSKKIHNLHEYSKERASSTRGRIITCLAIGEILDRWHTRELNYLSVR